MALLIDSDCVNFSDLTTMDSELPEIMEAEQLRANDIISQSWSSCANELSQGTQAFGWGMFANPHNAAVFNTGFFTTSTRRIGLEQIVVSSGYANYNAPLQKWMILRALADLYRAASNRAVGQDRYTNKLATTLQRIDDAKRDLWRSGVPVVFAPMPCPGAVHQEGAGVWSIALIDSVQNGQDATWNDLTVTWDNLNISWENLTTANPIIPEQTVDVAVTWTNGVVESGPSQIVTFTIPGNHFLRVSIAGLTPASGGIYAAASGWNLYVGAKGGTLYAQTSSPIDISTTSVVLASSPTANGPKLTSGQKADANLPLQTILQRA
jgi:hypothetical protein